MVECKLLVDELQSKFRTDLIYIVALLVVVPSHLARHDKFLVPMMHFSLVFASWPKNPSAPLGVLELFLILQIAVASPIESINSFLSFVLGGQVTSCR